MKNDEVTPERTEEVEPTTLPGDTTALTPVPMTVVEVTNWRYQRLSCFWGGPKGLDYGLLRGHQDIQVANAYPDQNSTYFVGQFKLPKGAYLKLRGHYGHLRYFSLTIANNLPGGVQGNGSYLRDDQIVPDEGSINPFMSPNRRDVPTERRRYTVYIRSGQAPRKPRPNTLYTGTNSERAGIHLAFRNYMPDNGYDGTGNVRMPPLEEGGLPVELGLPTVTLHLPETPIQGEEGLYNSDDVVLTGERMCRALLASKEGQKQEFPTKEWLQLIEDSWDRVNAPAMPAPMFQRFWNMDYSVKGAFIPDPIKRVIRCPASNDGAWLNNPDTVYMVGLFSLAFGEVVVIEGKMPTFPKTKHGQVSWPEEQTQVRYWSLTTGGTAPSGLGWSTIFDEEIPLVEDRKFTIVMSRAIDRPKNADREHGVKWIEFGAGEGHYIGARSWVNCVYIRYQASLSNYDWPNSPLNIPVPTEENPAPMDSLVMGPYYPTAKYMSKKEFERLA
ncbi:hypothetical protein [Microbulbifer sp. PSTR4-B]|uniref:hypothetical protein n=1 Tax=Microbulbifer sp. PSTR4-B TaxID=3243396 RepID=UPI0040399DA6